jgi:hypothetical protein
MAVSPKGERVALGKRTGRPSSDIWVHEQRPEPEQWEAERRALEIEIVRLERPSGQMALTGQKILELAKQAGFSVSKAGSGRTAPFARNGAIELHLRLWKSLSHLH